MIAWLFNIAALGVFAFAYYGYSWSDQLDLEQETIEVLQEARQTDEVQEESIPKKNTARIKREEKENIINALKEARKLATPHLRRQAASKIKKELTTMVERWGNIPNDVDWMQEVISNHIRPLKN